jgi:Rhodopirellula transposase DDE domain
VRRKGAGRPALSRSNPAVLEDLRRLVEPAVPAQAGMGDPMRPLLWVSKSLEKLASALRALNHAVSANTAGKMLMTLGYSRQACPCEGGGQSQDQGGQPPP